MTKLLMTLTACALGGFAHAAPPSFGGPPTTVMVLGSPHLSQMPKNVRPEMVGTLVDRLAATKPELIVVEGLSGEQCAHLQRFESRYPTMFETYCRKLDVAAAATGLDVVAATAAFEKTLATWPAEPTPAQRRALAAQFAAAGERGSALVQWLRLPPSERRDGDGLNAELIAELKASLAVFNETYAIGVALAVRLGHERVYLVDDHTADSIQASAGPGLEPAIQKIWNTPAAAQVAAPMHRREASIQNSADLLAYYRWINQAATLKSFADVDQSAAALDGTPPYHGRQYLAWWETRNLRMVANIRAAAGNRPGARVLAIVGSSHKVPYERYLGMMTDVKVVSVAPVLKP